ncbi:ENV1 protein, partial [Pomatorhinus ruficollis]|nr:ENV1 protein [Pomatorhinus ruficollis]
NRHMCKTEVVLRRSCLWAIPSASGLWACHKTSATPCISIKHFDFVNDFCVQVAVIPRVLYHTDGEMNQYVEGEIHLQKRELITGVTLAFLLSLGAAGTATGVSALVSQKQSLSQLQMTIDEDFQRIEQSISLLEKSLSSLSEVVLQNRRGLDPLLMHQGGLCAALKEQCCFYANYSGVIRDSMAELRERLAQRKRDMDAQCGWFDSFFSHSPWVLPLISTLMGPRLTILFVLIFGPCVLNKITQFVKTRLSRIDIMFLEQRQLT